MIPDKNGNTAKNPGDTSEKMGSFNLFDPVHFLQRILRNWYWFVILGFLGYCISYVYSRYYAQRVYASTLSLSISNNTASYFTPNQSINFIWGQGGNQDGVYLKKILLSRSHNEFLVKKLNLITSYTTKGLIKSTYLDQEDSPVFLEIDKNHPQQVNYPISLIPKGGNKYEVVLPDDGESVYLYNYNTEGTQEVPHYQRPKNKIIRVNEWYQSPNLRFKLVNNPTAGHLGLENVIVTLVPINQAVNSIIGSLNIDFDKELASIMIITKSGYNLNNTVNFLNNSVDVLIKKRLTDQNMVDRNTVEYLNDNLSLIRKKLDSSAVVLNNLKINNRLFDMENIDSKTLQKLNDLDAQKAELTTKINSLNSIKNSVYSNNIEKMISLNAAGIEDGSFNASVSELKALYEKRRELAQIYTPNSEPMREINRLLSDARNSSESGLRKYFDGYNNKLADINAQIAAMDKSLVTLPEKQRIFLDAQRGYNIIENTYNTLLTEQAKSQMRVATNQSNLTVIDKAKNLGQAPIAPNVNGTKMQIMGGLLLIPLIFLAIGELLDNRIRNLKELLSVTKIPLLGVIGRNNYENNLTVLNEPKSSVAEAFRAVRANLRFLFNEEEKSKVILVTSSISGEGKTYVSINIASVLGLSGKKTVLLGMDLRKPKIFGDFKINNKNGISNYLTGQVGMDEIINKTSIPGLDVITSGPIPPNPSELLMSDNNMRFIEKLKESYEYIIIDSPPVGLVADSFELIKKADTTIYVVRHEYTEKHMLRMITEKYFNKEVSNLGLVYNDYVAKQGYGYGYGYSYGYGYFEEDKNYKEPTIIQFRNRIRTFFNRK
ncbi:MAG: polysaccharide biosynthesis tyrosine autokinase [Weeksellaceae bacterium]|nr:polysaccharide biosynthesis tyrosine autokinase [Weeksellaceae bacterium]